MRIEDEDEKEKFRSYIQSYLRLYSYISQLATFADVGLEKLFIFLKYLNLKLPKRKQANLGDITSLVDLDSFRLEETFKGKIQLEQKDGEFLPMSDGASKSILEEEKDILSIIIEQINKVHGGQITDEDKIDLENMRNRISVSEEMKSVLSSDNSHTNKRIKFDELISTILLGYVNNRLDFYNKMEDPKVRTFVSDILFNELLKTHNRPIT